MTTKSRFTPGPWRRVHRYEIDGPLGEWVAACHVPNPEQAAADARLIRAAPDMHRLLSELAELTDGADILDVVTEKRPELLALLAQIDGTT